MLRRASALQSESARRSCCPGRDRCGGRRETATARDFDDSASARETTCNRAAGNRGRRARRAGAESREGDRGGNGWPAAGTPTPRVYCSPSWRRRPATRSWRSARRGRARAPERGAGAAGVRERITPRPRRRRSKPTRTTLVSSHPRTPHPARRPARTSKLYFAASMWRHNYAPVSGSLGASATVAAVPVFVLFLMLGVFRKPAWMSALAALISALVVALAVYGMPLQLAVISTLYGAAYGLFPIAWIVFTSIMLYRLAVDTGKFEIIKDSVGALTDDRRLQALFIAFSFGAFIEGAAGFGAPVAVSGAMLAGLGFDPFYAAGICLLANTAPVAFGSIGIPVITLAAVTGQ